MSDNDSSKSNESEDEIKASVSQMSEAIADRLVSSRQHTIPIFSGAKGECPIKFMRIFERVGKALKWDWDTKMAKFPNYLSGAGEEFHYINVDCAHEGDEEQTDHDFIRKPENWDQLRGRFLDHFMRGDYKSHLSRELRARKKLESESMIVYITSI